MATSQVSDGRSLIYGAWDNLLMGFGGAGPDVIVDPCTAAPEGKITITINLWHDSAIRRANAFAIVSAPGNQS